MMRCEKSDGVIVAMMSVPVNAGNSREDKTSIMRKVLLWRNRTMGEIDAQIKWEVGEGIS